MKRKGYLFEKMCDMDNLRLAEVNAGHGKGSRRPTPTASLSWAGSST